MPGPLPEALYTSAQLREMDRIAIQEYGIPGITLMERAGVAACALGRARWSQARRIVVLCGTGNNGGDGFVVARCLREAGLEVQLLGPGDPARLHGDAASAYRAANRVGLTLTPFRPAHLEGADLLVDALFGTGLDREITGPWRDVIVAANDSRLPCLAIDVPSGLNSDSGAIMGVAIHATATITFIGLKRGLFVGQGPACAGEVLYDDLGLPGEILGRFTAAGRRPG